MTKSIVYASLLTGLTLALVRHCRDRPGQRQGGEQGQIERPRTPRVEAPRGRTPQPPRITRQAEPPRRVEQPKAPPRVEQPRRVEQPKLTAPG